MYPSPKLSTFASVLILIVCIYLFVYLYVTENGQQDLEAASVPSTTASTASDLFALNETLTTLKHELKMLAAVQKEIHQERTRHIEGEKEIADLGRQENLAEKLASTKQLAPLQRRSSSVDAKRDRVKPLHTSPPKQVLPVTDSTSSSVSRTRRAVLFTMDSITSYEENSRKGGAAGEILVRRSLEHALGRLGVSLRVVKSDEEFATVSGSDYDIIIVDPWTWAAKGWVPKPPLRGQDSKVFVLDFFGSKRLRGRGLFVSPDRFLTAFGAPDNTFLGYYTTHASATSYEKKLQQGVVWGKDPKHFEGKTGMLKAVLNQEPSLTLVATATRNVFQHQRMAWRGHQTAESWQTLLRQSRFLIGLGDPLLGPSAIDAISAGCMYINPVYSAGKAKKGYASQHPYAAEKIGKPYVCNYQLGDMASLLQCVQQAMATVLDPLSVPDFTESAHLERVRRIFNLNDAPSTHRRLQAKDSSWMFQSEKKWDEQWSKGSWNYMDIVPVERAKHAVVGELMAIYSGNVSADGQIISTLDVGCGEGTLYGFLGPERQRQYVGIDLSREAISAARRKHEKGRFIHAPAHSFTPKRRRYRFETIVFSDVLYYIDHESTLRRYDEHLLADNGVVIISIFQKPDTNQVLYENIFSAARSIFDKVDEMNLAGTTRKTAHAASETVAKTGFRIEVFRKRTRVT